MGDSPLLPSKINTSYPAKDCLPPGVEVIWVSGWVAKLTGLHGFLTKLFDGLKRESFQRLPTFYSAFVKIRRQAKTTDGKINYRPRSTRYFEATGGLLERIYGRSDRLLGQSTQPWDSMYRESKKLTEFNRMAVDRLKDHTGGEKTLGYSKVRRFLFKSLHFHRLQKQSFIFLIQILINMQIARVT